MLWIIWFHVKACWRDLQVRRLGDLYYDREGSKDVLYNERQEWRIR
jgi:hypothetical protein